MCVGLAHVCDPRRHYLTGNVSQDYAMIVGCEPGEARTTKEPVSPTTARARFPVCDERSNQVAFAFKTHFNLDRGTETELACRPLEYGWELGQCHTVAPSTQQAVDHLRCPSGSVATGMCASDERQQCPGGRFSGLRCCHLVLKLNASVMPAPSRTRPASRN